MYIESKTFLQCFFVDCFVCFCLIETKNGERICACGEAPWTRTVDNLEVSN